MDWSMESLRCLCQILHQGASSFKLLRSLGSVFEKDVLVARLSSRQAREEDEKRASNRHKRFCGIAEGDMKSKKDGFAYRAQCHHKPNLWVLSSEKRKTMCLLPSRILDRHKKKMSHESSRDKQTVMLLRRRKTRHLVLERRRCLHGAIA